MTSGIDEGIAVRELIRAGRVVVDAGLVVGSGGNLSARLPDGRYLVTRTGTWLDRLDEDAFAIGDLDGDDAPEGGSGEWRMHQLTYRARPDVQAMIHLHPQRLVLLDAAGHEVRLITTDHSFYLGAIGRVGYHRPVSEELAQAVAQVSADHNVLVMARHGCSALGADIDMALRRVLNLNEAANLTFDALALGCGPEIEMPPADRAALTEA